MAALGIMVLQVFRYYGYICGNYDVFFAYKNRQQRRNYLHRPVRHIRVSAALWAFCYDLVLRHFNILLERYYYMQFILHQMQT